jgi:hypothetical protein
VDGGSLDLFVPALDPVDHSLLLSLSYPSTRTEANVSLVTMPTVKTGIVNFDSAVDEREGCRKFYTVRYWVSRCVMCSNTFSSVGTWSLAARYSELCDCIR